MSARIAEQLLRAHLRQDAPARETLVMRLMLTVVLAGTVLTTILELHEFGRAPVGMIGLAAGALLYHVAARRAIRRGWYHPAIAWINVFAEVTGPAIVLYLALGRHGPVFTNLVPIYPFWCASVMLAALRANRALALAAGALAATEQALFHLVFIAPHLPPDLLPDQGWRLAAVRAVGLLLCGTVTAAIAQYLVRRAEAALCAVREQDLMGKYFLHQRIGTGGMAEVFRATYSPEGGFEKTLAVKRILPELSSDPSFTEQFLNEARLGSMLTHPNVVQVLDVGKFQGSYILAMELVDGVPLSKMLASAAAQLPLAAVTYLGCEVASALDYIHRRVGTDGKPLALVHRDVNPPNILISRIGEVKLGDFGVALAAHHAAPGVAGKVGYMSPEQLDLGPLDGRTDLFALGVTLYEAIVGRRLWLGLDAAAMRAAVRRPVRPSELRSDVPPALDAIVLDLLAFDPANRPASGAELRARLLALEGALAPLPNGQPALADAVAALLGSKTRDGSPTILDASDPGTVTVGASPARRIGKRV